MGENAQTQFSCLKNKEYVRQHAVNSSQSVMEYILERCNDKQFGLQQQSNGDAVTFCVRTECLKQFKAKSSNKIFNIVLDQCIEAKILTAIGDDDSDDDSDETEDNMIKLTSGLAIELHNKIA